MLADSVIALVLVLPKAIVRTLVPPAVIEFGLNDFVTVGGAVALTVKLSVVAVALLPRSVCNVPTAIVLA